MSVTIQKATPEDSALLMECMKIIGSETDNLTFGKEGLPYTTEAEAAFLASFDDPHNGIFLVAKEMNRIVGSASLCVLPRRMSHRAELGLSILKAYWNQGLGSLFLEQLIAFAKENNIEILELQVRSDNAAAIHLYEKYGFRRLCTYPKFFKIGKVYADFDYMTLNV